MKIVSIALLVVSTFLAAGCTVKGSDPRAVAEASFRAILAKDYVQFQQVEGAGVAIPNEQAWREASFMRDGTPGQAIKAQWVKGPITGFALGEIVDFPGLRPQSERLVQVRFVLSGKRYVATFPLALRNNAWSPGGAGPENDGFFVGFEEPSDGCATLEPALPSPAPFRIVGTDTASIMNRILQSEEMQKRWRERTSFFAPDSSWGGWATLLMAEPKLDSSRNLGPIALTLDSTRVSYLVRNGYKKPHSLRLVFLLDFHPVPLLDLEGIRRDYYDWPELAPQADAALTFSVPPLSAGFHQLSILQIADPQSTLDDRVYRAVQQNSFWEDRFDVWVDTLSRPAGVPAFENTAVGRAVSHVLGTVEFVHSQTDPANIPLSTLALKPGAEECLYLKIFQNRIEPTAPHVERVPLYIALFWNDRMSGIYNYEMPPDAPTDAVLKLWVTAPLEPGAYQLGAATLAFPGYSQYDPTGKERTGFYNSSFSRRILVTVGQ